MDSFDIKGRVRVFNIVDGKKYLVHDNHNVITYKGREVMSKLMVGATSLSHWSLHIGTGWVGMFGEPDPSITELYYDVSQTDTTIAAGDTSLIYSMHGKTASSPTSSTTDYCYPLLSLDFKGVDAEISVDTMQTFSDNRVTDVHNAFKVTCVVGNFANGTVSGFPINEMGLFFNSVAPKSSWHVSQDGTSIMEDPSAVMVAYEPIYDAVFASSSDKIEVEWTISF